MPMLMWLIKLFGGIDFAGIAKAAAQGYAAKQDAGVKRDQIDADLLAKETELSVREASLNAQIIIAEQGNWLTRLARPLIAGPVIIYLWKVVVWDKVLALGVTDPLSPWLAGLFSTVIGSYFIGRTIEKTVSVVRNRLSGVVAPVVVNPD